MKRYLTIILLITTSLCKAIDRANDSEKPLNIESSSVEYIEEKLIAIYTGNVIATQGTRRLEADKLVLNLDEKKNIREAIAYGHPAKIKSRPNPEKPFGYGRAKVIKYYPKDERADLFGAAKLEQDNNSITGEKLSYYFNSGSLISPNDDKSRVTFIMYPKEKTS